MLPKTARASVCPAWVAVVVLLGGCRQPPTAAAAPAPACDPGASALVRDQLYLGRGLPDGGEISDSAWTQFLQVEVTPRFPDGITVLEASGQWRSQDGNLVQERSWILVVYHPDAAPAEQAVAEIAQAYKRTFHQEAVLRDRTATCVAF